MKVKKIIVHCSDSEWGDSSVIKKWHLERGFRDIGYHYVILNGYSTYRKFKNNRIVSADIGRIEKGRPDDISGAHVRGMNRISLGVCLIGVKKFGIRQKWSGIRLVLSLVKRYNLKISDVLGHYETETGAEQGKTCPNIKMKWFRMMLRLANMTHNLR